MSDLAARAAQNQQALNPANATAQPVATRKRIPMSLPMQKLQVPEIPGYHLHWMKGTPERLAQADRAGYEFVDESEVQLNAVALGGDASTTGNTDMGTRVSVLAGSESGADGQALRLYLMKQRLEHYNEDQEGLLERSEQVADALRGGLTGSEKDAREDRGLRYVDPKRTLLPEMFKKPQKR